MSHLQNLHFARMKPAIMALACALLFAGVLAQAEEASAPRPPPAGVKAAPKSGPENKNAAVQEISLQSLPPSVVRTVPQAGDAAVDAAVTRQITATFSKDMKDGSWSWSGLSKETTPEIVGTPKYLDDRRTCVVDVKLEPKKTYVFWLNSQKFGGFKDSQGNSAIPYLLVFQTR